MPESAALAERVARELGCDVITPEVRRFPDGELYVRITQSLTNHDALLFGSLYPAPAERFLLASFLASTARDRGARNVGLVAPYLAFMRQDAVFNEGEGVTSRYFAKLVSSTFDWLVTVDPHLHRHNALDGLYTIPTTIARSSSAIATWLRDNVERPYLVGPDAESIQWVRAIADACGAPFTILKKTRRGDRDVSITSPPPDGWQGLTPILIDDIVSTGRTMIEATRQLRASGLPAPLCVAIHAVFADTVVDDLASAGAAGIISCDTITHASNKICVVRPIADAARAYLSRTVYR